MAILSDEEFLRLKQGIAVALSFPLIDDLEDYVWEAVFAYMKGLPSAYIRDKQRWLMFRLSVGGI